VSSAASRGSSQHSLAPRHLRGRRGAIISCSSNGSGHIGRTSPRCCPSSHCATRMTSQSTGDERRLSGT
jgi:hypothetical protein